MSNSVLVRDPDASVLTVDVWDLSLISTPERITAWESLLSPDEQQRQQRLQRPQDRQAFGVFRGQLRQILATYLGQEARSLSFQYNAYGKPSLATASDLHFNFSHSQDRALCAVTWGSPVGVDIEFHRPCPVLRLARRWFSTEEYTWLEGQPASAQEEGFFQLWTMREAWSKAIGHGIPAWAELRVNPQTWQVLESRDHQKSVQSYPLQVHCLQVPSLRSQPVSAALVVDQGSLPRPVVLRWQPAHPGDLLI